MRRRAKRDLITLTGVVVILAAIVTVNIYLRLEGLKGQYRKARYNLEVKYRKDGYEVSDWEMLRATKGTLRKGATFSDKLKEKDGYGFNLCGFMAPIDQFRNVTEYMLLPTPITCYFCDAPPPRDVLEVKLDNPGEMVNEAIINGGMLQLNEEAGSLFFYTLMHGRWKDAITPEEMKVLTDKEVSTEHRMHLMEQFNALKSGKKVSEVELLAPQAPLSGDSEGLIDDIMPKIGPADGIHQPEVDMGELIPAQNPDELGAAE